MLRIIPLSDRIAERFVELAHMEFQSCVPAMSEAHRDRLMVLLATLVDQVRMPGVFLKTCRRLASEDFGLPREFLVGPSGERALKKALAEVAWNLIEPDEIELWAKLQRLASSSASTQSKYAIADFGSPSKDMDGNEDPSSRCTPSR